MTRSVMKPRLMIRGRGPGHGRSRFPLKQDPHYYLFEFACHEGNYLSMISMLGGARLAEK